MHSTSFGEMMQVAQSPVGKVLSRRAMPPPIVGLSSIRKTRNPPAERSNEAWMPAIPPPHTSTDPQGVLPLPLTLVGVGGDLLSGSVMNSLHRSRPRRHGVSQTEIG